MSVPNIVIAVALAIDCLILIPIVLMQKNRAHGVGTALGGAGNQTFYDKNKGRSKEGKLELYTKILGVIYFILCLTMGFIGNP